MYRPQLYHGADEYGVAGSWLSDALNTNIHTFEVNKTFTPFTKDSKRCSQHQYSHLRKNKTKLQALHFVILSQHKQT